MHLKNIIHRDIKEDNILLLDSKNLKVCIADLGLACKTTDTYQMKLKCGTPGYVAPEVLIGAPFSPKADIFSLGCVFYYLVTGKKLFST